MGGGLLPLSGIHTVPSPSLHCFREALLHRRAGCGTEADPGVQLGLPEGARFRSVPASPARAVLWAGGEAPPGSLKSHRLSRPCPPSPAAGADQVGRPTSPCPGAGTAGGWYSLLGSAPSSALSASAPILPAAVVPELERGERSPPGPGCLRRVLSASCSLCVPDPPARARLPDPQPRACPATTTCLVLPPAPSASPKPGPHCVRETCRLGPSTLLLISWRCPGLPAATGGGDRRCWAGPGRGWPCLGVRVPGICGGGASATPARAGREAGGKEEERGPVRSLRASESSGSCPRARIENRDFVCPPGCRRYRALTPGEMLRGPHAACAAAGCRGPEWGEGFSRGLLSCSFPRGSRATRPSALGVAFATPWKKLGAPEGFSAGAAERLPVMRRVWPGGERSTPGPQGTPGGNGMGFLFKRQEYRRNRRTISPEC